jgi:hypothetical protein
LQQLDGLVGIGPALAQKIISARPYSSVDGLLNVKGIGEKMLQKIKEQGLAYVSGQTSQDQTATSPTPIQSTTANAKSDTIYPAGVIINELLPSPKGADEAEEWIELYNENSTDADLSGWKLQDTQGTTTTFVFPNGTLIGSHEYLVIKRPESKILLNNDTDGLNLLWPDAKIIDTVSYTSALTGQSYNKTSSDWQWSTTPTPGSANNITTDAPKVAPTQKLPLPKVKKSGNKVSVASASVSEPTQNIFSKDLNQEDSSSNPWLLFLVAIGITFVAGAIVVLIKFIIYKNHVRS